ncbi:MULTISPECIES: hypothetical protein [unclassified Streptomyces]|uniref:hypothetical protein n=1 Tax=unclassified Streptomyces TaxID=2593676 RepID=UPI001F393D03|nr:MULTISPECIES: hypothetical protein [unclassified Streptomyces]MCF0086597.1 hypothetical protein [Streptomyces sp. MH192]MCF0098751.1 hypothetical protein [Streptomyces sp. MH191]
MPDNLAAEVMRLRRELAQVKKGSRIAHGASIEDSAIQVRDSAGVLRGVIGVQDDGTVGLIAHNGPPPTAPTAPAVTPSLGGLRVTWDGTFADGSNTPADFDHVAVHVSTSSGFTPSAATFVGTITRAGDGGMLPVTPLPYQEHYVVLVGVNTSGIQGAASAETAATPVKVEGPDLEVGSVTAAAIQAGAVEAEKLEAVLALATRILAGDPAAARVELNPNGLRVYDEAGVLKISFDAATGDASFTGTITGSVITGGIIQTATSGERIAINEEGLNGAVVYDSTGEAIGEFSPRGLLVKGEAGAVIWINPDAVYPTVRFYNAENSTSAYLQLVEPTTGDADLEALSGVYTSGGRSMRSRSYLGHDAIVIERYATASPNPRIGGRVFLNDSYANFAYTNGTDTSQDTGFTVSAGLANLVGGRFSVSAPASTFSALYVEAAAAHTGNLARFFRNGIDYFKVDKDGNTTVTGSLTAGNMATGSVSITPSAANTPTSALVTYNVTGSTVRGFATAQTTVPGVRAPVGSAGVTGVGVSSVTNASMLVWVNRENTTATTVNWQVIGS